MAIKNLCPCGSGAEYAACCQRYHGCTVPIPSATEVVRARFSAFVLGNPRFLVWSLHPHHSDMEKPEETVREVYSRSSRKLRYQELKILDASEPDREGVARVLFFVKVFAAGTDRSFLEASGFQKDRDSWKYLFGDGVFAKDLTKPIEQLTLADFPY